MPAAIMDLPGRSISHQEIEVNQGEALQFESFLSHRGKARHRAASMLQDSDAREFEERNDRRPNPVGLH